MKPRAGNFLNSHGLAATCLLALCWSEATGAQEAAPVALQATGLRPPTPVERDWMDQHMKKTKKANLNKLGLERVNHHRQEKGLAPLDLPVAPDGEEVVAEGAIEAGLSTIVSAAQPQQLVGGALPAAVDNSTLPSFPSVRNQGSIGSCASFSTTYYAATHMLGLARGFNNKNDADNSTKLSPKWTYPMVNGGQDSGSWFSPTCTNKAGRIIFGRGS